MNDVWERWKKEQEELYDVISLSDAGVLFQHRRTKEEKKVQLLVEETKEFNHRVADVEACILYQPNINYQLVFKQTAGKLETWTISITRTHAIRYMRSFVNAKNLINTQTSHEMDQTFLDAISQHQGIRLLLATGIPIYNEMMWKKV